MNNANDEPCKICGCTETNLVDGFYYCVECGTQDTNVRETVVEYAFVGDGGTGIGVRKRLTLAKKADKPQMSDDWFRWHALNFLLQGLANEVIECGAAPSFKTKLLWIWTRYMKKYQNKADFGLEDNETNDNEHDNAAKKKKPEEDFDYSCDEDCDEYNSFSKKKYGSIKINKISMHLVITLLYVALNLDRSRIQLSHLMRFILEGRLSIVSWTKHVPEDLRPRHLQCSLTFHKAWLRFSLMAIRVLTPQLFIQLDLGTPLVPDLRLLVDDYMHELCLPKQMTPLVHALMRYRCFEYLEVSNKPFKKMPSYELYVIAHILCALKICFGLDGKYEKSLSDAVTKINKMEKHPKSYNAEPTERLFNFDEWIKYMLMRQSQLWAHTLLLGAPNIKDVDDYVAAEHQFELPDFKKSLRHEITWNIINKLPDVKPNVIPRSELPTTLTPYSTYTRVVIDHVQDPEVKKMLSEDFTQYSMKYFFDMHLVDLDEEHPVNLLTGVNPDNFVQRHNVFYLGEKVRAGEVKIIDRRMVYVKDCDNPNWMTTKRPTLQDMKDKIEMDKNDCENQSKENKSKDDDTQSVTTVDINDLATINDEFENKVFMADLSDINTIDKRNQDIDNNSVCEGADLSNNRADLDNKYETASDIQSVTTVDISEFCSFNETKVDGPENNNLTDISNCVQDSKMFDFNSVSDIQMDIDVETPNKEEDLNIREEDEGVNIFDENFNEFDAKNENVSDVEIPDSNYESAGENNRFILPSSFRFHENQEYIKDRTPSESSNDSFHITPESLDRNKAIKELIIHECQKHKVSLPGKFIIQNRKKLSRPKKHPVKPERAKVKGLVKKWIREIIDVYNKKLEQDLFVQMSKAVQSAIADFNQSQAENMEVDEPDNVSNVNNEENEPEIPNDEGVAETISDSRIDDAMMNDETEDQGKLFSDESDGETHAEDILPKTNPEFDEKTHDISQLYLKPLENIDLPELKLDKNIFKIIDENIAGDDIDKPESSPEESEADSDPEMNLTLINIQEKQLIEKTIRKHAPIHRTKIKLPRLIGNPIPPYNYWMKLYNCNSDTLLYADLKNMQHRQFTKNIASTMPESFVTVLLQCAEIVCYPPYHVYKSLVRVENCFKERCLHNRNNYLRCNIFKGRRGVASAYNN